MNRYITMETYAGDIFAYTEDEDWSTALENDDVAEWVWQYAPDKLQAIGQHYAKHDEWLADIDAGIYDKATY